MCISVVLRRWIPWSSPTASLSRGCATSRTIVALAWATSPIARKLAKLPATAKVDQVVGQWLGVAFVGGNHKWILGARKAPAPCMLRKPITQQCAVSQGMYWPDGSEVSMGVVPACYAKVYVDETLMNGGYPTRPFEVTSVFADQVEAIEWYAGASQTPAKYADLNSGCGVLVIHTRHIP